MRAVLVTLAILVASCDRKPPKPLHEVTPTGVELPWTTDHADAIAKLQGIWVVKGIGWPQYVAAWKFSGESVTIYDAETKAEIVDVFKFDSPCSVHVTGAGGKLVIDGDTIYLGLGDGGFTDGTTTYLCTFPGTVYATPSGCKTYGTAPHWDVIESTCTIRTRTDGRREFVVDQKTGAFAGESTVEIVSDTILLSKQLAANRMERQLDWETAKANADAIYAAKRH